MVVLLLLQFESSEACSLCHQNSFVFSGSINFSLSDCLRCCNLVVKYISYDLKTALLNFVVQLLIVESFNKDLTPR